MRVAPLLAVVLAACAPRHPPLVPIAPPTPVPVPAAEAPVTTAALPVAASGSPKVCAPDLGCIPYCVVRDGRLQSVDVEVMAGGDSLYRGQRLSQAFPVDSTYIAKESWFVNLEPLALLGGRYVVYGLPRILATTDVVPVATFRGVPVFAEPGADRRWTEVVYLPTRPGCEFQPYQRAGIK